MVIHSRNWSLYPVAQLHGALAHPSRELAAGKVTIIADALKPAYIQSEVLVERISLTTYGG
jgi:hypothetical protein